MAILSPTPANTPQILNEIIVAPNQEEKNKTGKTLFMDFSEKSQDSDVSECDINNEDYEAVSDEGLNKLCEAMSKISFNKVTAKFTRKHTRFVYNSDGKLAGEWESSSNTKEERVV
ncbi:hypothetical protein Tco_0693404 [Tanacetum coccineum]